ncbi:MAG: transaldolase family protein, partial [Pseudomonadota bacterium]
PDHTFTADDDPGVASVRNIYRLFKERGYSTVVMGASFRNAGEIEALAGCDRLTISPDLLATLASDTGTLPRQLTPGDAPPSSSPRVDSESAFRFGLNQDAMATEKLAEGIRGFVADQVRLEALLTDKLLALRAA